MKKISFSIFVFFSLNLSSCSFSKCEVTAEIFVKSKLPPFSEQGYIDVLDKNGIPRKQSVFIYRAKSEIMRMQSEPIVQHVIDKLKLENTEGHPLKATQFKENLQAKYEEKDKILYISYKNPNPILVEEIINTLLEIYVEESIHSNLPSFTVFLNNSIPKTNQEIKLPHTPNKQKRNKIIAEYWKEIEEMNKDIPEVINLNKYQSHNMRIIKMAGSSCSKN